MDRQGVKVIVGENSLLVPDHFPLIEFRELRLVGGLQISSFACSYIIHIMQAGVKPLEDGGLLLLTEIEESSYDDIRLEIRIPKSWAV